MAEGPIRKLRIGIIDLVTKGPTRALYARVMNANLASIMPQVVGVWCEAEGHEATLVCYTGFEDLVEQLPDSVDLVLMFNIADVNRHVTDQLANLLTPLITADNVNDFCSGFGQHLPDMRGDTLSVRHAEDNDATVGQIEKIIGH